MKPPFEPVTGRERPTRTLSTAYESSTTVGECTGF
jgi:hypothetical protein